MNNNFYVEIIDLQMTSVGLGLKITNHLILKSKIAEPKGSNLEIGTNAVIFL
jgi:hypothetical protein